MDKRGQPTGLNEVIIPEGEGPLSQAITIRMPKKLLERIEKATRDTGNTRSDTILHLLRWGISAHETRSKKR